VSGDFAKSGSLFQSFPKDLFLKRIDLHYRGLTALNIDGHQWTYYALHSSIAAFKWIAATTQTDAQPDKATNLFKHLTISLTIDLAGHPLRTDCVTEAFLSDRLNSSVGQLTDQAPARSERPPACRDF
ncbi:hypothetical protein, partial [Pseudomonas lundensis]|uniref:hypothetical protein n=1 Tax=Pseudomonas lundensis TaxID=86185 RepID=UPI001D005259